MEYAVPRRRRKMRHQQEIQRIPGDDRNQSLYEVLFC